MKYSTLGHCGLEVSRVCLGTMTWGTQNDQADANAQIDFALEQGINFIDTAEVYAVPPTADTYGATETIIGTPHFGRHAPGRISFTDVDTQAHSDQMLEILQALDACVKAGKIRHFGLSQRLAVFNRKLCSSRCRLLAMVAFGRGHALG